MLFADPRGFRPQTLQLPPHRFQAALLAQARLLFLLGQLLNFRAPSQRALPLMRQTAELRARHEREESALAFSPANLRLSSSSAIDSFS